MPLQGRIRFKLSIVSNVHIDGLVQENVPPLLTHWSYIFLALTHRYICESDTDMIQLVKTYFPAGKTKLPPCSTSYWFRWYQPLWDPGVLCNIGYPSKNHLNSLAPGWLGCNFKTAAIFNLFLLIGIFTLSNGNALRWMPWDFTDDKSTLVQVMPWCRQATSHYLNLCWPSSMSPYGVTRPQWVNSNLMAVSRSCSVQNFNMIQ